MFEIPKGQCFSLFQFTRKDSHYILVLVIEHTFEFYPEDIP